MCSSDLNKKTPPAAVLGERFVCLFGVFHLELFELDIVGVGDGFPGSQRLQDARHVDDHPGRQPEPKRDKSRPLHEVNGMLFEFNQPERKGSA